MSWSSLLEFLLAMGPGLGVFIGSMLFIAISEAVDRVKAFRRRRRREREQAEATERDDTIMDQWPEPTKSFPFQSLLEEL